MLVLCVCVRGGQEQELASEPCMMHNIGMAGGKMWWAAAAAARFYQFCRVPARPCASPAALTPILLGNQARVWVAPEG